MRRFFPLALMVLLILPVLPFLVSKADADAAGPVTLLNYSTAHNGGQPIKGTFTSTCDTSAGCSESVSFQMPPPSIILNEPYKPNTASFYLSKTGSPGCHLRADVFNLDVQALTGKPSSTTPLISSSLVDCATVTAGTTQISFPFSTTQTISVNTFYGLAVTINDNSTVMTATSITVWGNSIADSTRGNWYIWKPSAWSANGANPIDAQLTGDPVSLTQTNLGNAAVISSGFFPLLYMGIGGSFTLSLVSIALIGLRNQKGESIAVPVIIMGGGLLASLGLLLLLVFASSLSSTFKGLGL